jgi:hypothetical protein
MAAPFDLFKQNQEGALWIGSALMPEDAHALLKAKAGTTPDNTPSLA